VVEIILVCLAIGLFWLVKEVEFRKIYTKVDPAIVPTEVIFERSDEVIGSYRGLKIHELVWLSDDRPFVFESVAIEADEGFFVEHPELQYILVDGCLLYRELEPTE